MRVTTHAAKEWRRVFRREAGRIWLHQARANRNGLVLNEETITETALVQISDSIDRRYLRVHAYNKREEVKTGADWEWIVIGDRRSIVFRVQAKRLYPNGAYRSLDPRGAQTRTLIAQAKRWKAHPAFVFYNDKASVGASGPIRTIAGCQCDGFKGPSYWGAAIAHASHVYAVGQKQFAPLRSLMIPWHCMMCQLQNSNLFNPRAELLRQTVPTGGPDDFVEAEPIRWEEDKGSQYAELRSQGGDWHQDYLSRRELAGVVLFDLATDQAKDR